MGSLIPDSPFWVWFFGAALLIGTLALTGGVIWLIVKIIHLAFTCTC